MKFLKTCYNKEIPVQNEKLDNYANIRSVIFQNTCTTDRELFLFYNSNNHN